MKKLLYISFAATSLFLAGCVSPQQVVDKLDDNQALIFGKMKVVDENGQDMPVCTIAEAVYGDDSFLVMEVEPGKVNLGNISCYKNHDQYSIITNGMRANVSKAGMASYFGDVTIKLSPAGTYHVNIKDNFDGAKYQLGGSLPTGKSLLKAGGNKNWTKHYTTRRIP